MLYVVLDWRINNISFFNVIKLNEIIYWIIWDIYSHRYLWPLPNVQQVAGCLFSKNPQVFTRTTQPNKFNLLLQKALGKDWKTSKSEGAKLEDQGPKMVNLEILTLCFKWMQFKKYL